MKDRVVLVTGSTDGIGKQTALELAKLGASVIVHGRSKAKALAVAAEICRESNNEHIEVLTSDLSLMSNVRSFARQIQQRFDRLDVLINNAGFFAKERVLTKEGLETTFAVNHVAPFLLTLLLLDILKSSGSQGRSSRIINVSSIAHQRATLDFENLQGEKKFDGFMAYAATKLMSIMMTYELAERLQGIPVTVNCLHPGVVTTKLLQASVGTPGGEVAAGAETSVYLASSSEVEGVSGKYFVKKQAQPTSPSSNDAVLRKQLWQRTEKMVGLS